MFLNINKYSTTIYTTFILLVLFNFTGYGPIVAPYPNAADDLVNLDFSDYPEGTYYIYIYDIYGILKYYGETSNTLKTISTVNLPNGLYFLSYYNGIEILQTQLRIQH
ncbi:MAG: T9SS type A sorting domain-containing protein [Flavobacteriales bacterium]|nr:T9SS type A sorting domain-containing protein [Flavobacteriales bacterium]